jgi:hypothetical protein
VGPSPARNKYKKRTMKKGERESKREAEDGDNINMR